MASLLVAIKPLLLPLMVVATALEIWLAARTARDNDAAQLRLVEIDLRSRAYRGAICHPWFVQDLHAYDLLEHLDDQRLAAEYHQIGEAEPNRHPDHLTLAGRSWPPSMSVTRASER